MPAALLARFLATKARTLRSRARRLVALTPKAVGFRPDDLPYAPSAAHFKAANRRLGEIDAVIRQRLEQLGRASSDPQAQLVAMAMVEREVDRARRAFGMFFEIFAQRGTAFAPALAAHDAIAADCYRAIHQGAPGLLTKPLLEPLTYLEHGYSPATMRRGVTLNRLLGERNPFPLIRIPYDRDRPWQAVFLHEVAHNIQADLGLWVENKQAVQKRLLRDRAAPRTTAIYSRWHKEIFADLASVLLGGPAVAWGLAEFLAHPPSKVLTYRPGGAHPTNYLRVLILAEMLRRMRFAEEGRRLAAVWTRLYQPVRQGHRLPKELLASAGKVIPAVVDEIAWQPRRGLAERAPGDIIRFAREDQARIRRGGMLLRAGRVPAALPPRFLVSASRYAIEAGADTAKLSRAITAHLARRAPATRTGAVAPPLPQAA